MGDISFTDECDNTTVRVGNCEITVNGLMDASNHSTQSGDVLIRVRKPSGDKNSLGTSSSHVSQTNSSELVGVQEESMKRAKSAPRTRHGVAAEEENECSRSGVKARREIFERRLSAAGNTTGQTSDAGNTVQSNPRVSIFKQRASMSSSMPKNTAVVPTTPSGIVGKLGVSKFGPCEPGVPIQKPPTVSCPFQYEYDYDELKNKWSTLASSKEHPSEVADPDVRKRLAFLKRLNQYRRRDIVVEPDIVKSVQRRGSTGKMTGLQPLEKESTTANKVDGKHKSKIVMASKQKKAHKKKKQHSKEIPRLVKRRNSMGNTRLAYEPIVALYWNPARERLMDTICNLTYETQETDDVAIPSPPTMYDRGIVQRRASTGRLRLDEEDTTWLYAREDHEIADADVRGGKHHKKRSKKKKCKEKMKAAKEALRQQSSMNSKSKKSPPSLHRKMSVVPNAQSSHSKQEEPANETPSDDDTDAKPRRRVERRGSTGAVPLAEEADSRLHRKKKMRQEHKRRQRATNLSREGKSMKPDASEEAPPKASLLGLLDPSMALDDGSDDPSSWLVGDGEHVFTIAPYKPPPPKIRKTQKLTPRELELDLDGDSSDEESENNCDDDFERQFFSSRPGTTRGKSFTTKTKNDPGDDKTQTTENDSDDDGDDFAANFFGLRPGTTRGKSFAAKRDPPKPVHEKVQTPLGESDSDGDCSPANLFDGRPGATRGTSFMKKRDPPKPVDETCQTPDSDSDGDCSPANFFGGRPGVTRGRSFLKENPAPEPVIETPERLRMSTVDEHPEDDSPKPAKTVQKSRSAPTEPTSPVTKVKDKKSRVVGEKSSSSSHKVPWTPKTPTKKKNFLSSRDTKSPEHKKSGFSTEEKAPRTPKTLSKTKKLSSTSTGSCSTKSPTKGSAHKKHNKNPKKDPETRDWSFKITSPSRTLHGYEDKDAAKPFMTKAIPLDPSLGGSDKPLTHRHRVSTSATVPATKSHHKDHTPSTHRRRASTSAAAVATTKPDKDDLATKTTHSASSTTSGASFGNDQDVAAPPPRKSSSNSKADKKLLKALALISKADQSQVIEALHELGETNPAVESIQGGLLGKKEKAPSKTKKHGKTERKQRQKQKPGG